MSRLQQHCDELIDAGFIREQPPAGVGLLPLPGSGWRLLDFGPEHTPNRYLYVSDVVLRALQLGTDLAEVVRYSQSMQAALRRRIRTSARRVLLLKTLFLPVYLAGSVPFASRPGGRFTTGMVIVGFLAFLSIAGFIASLIAQQWTAAGACAYWWIGSALLQAEFRTRGLVD